MNFKNSYKEFTKEKRIIAMIPARIGSERLKQKNLQLINGRPMISFAIQAAKKSGIFDKILVNSDSNLFKEIAKENLVDFYLREESFGSSTTKADDMIADFIISNNFQKDIIVWVNPVSPLMSYSEIKDTVEHFLKKKLDTLISSDERKVHFNLDGKAMNYKKNEKFAQTQDLKSVNLFVYSIMIFDSEVFMDSFRNYGYGMFAGKFGTYPASKLATFFVKTKEDLDLVRLIAKALNL